MNKHLAKQQKKYFLFFGSIIFSFIFLFLSCISIYFDGIFADFSSIHSTIKFVMFIIRASLFCFFLVCSALLSIRMDFKNKRYFYFYLGFMAFLFVGSVLLSRLTVKLDIETKAVQANVAPFFLIFLPCVILVKFFLHVFVFKDIIKSRKEDGLPTSLGDVYFAKDKLSELKISVLAKYIYQVFFVMAFSLLFVYLFGLFGFDFKDHTIASCFMLGFLIAMIASITYCLCTCKKSNLTESRKPFIFFFAIVMVLMIPSLIIGIAFPISSDSSLFSIHLGFLIQHLLILLLFFVLFPKNIFSAMIRPKVKNKVTQEK